VATPSHPPQEATPPSLQRGFGNLLSVVFSFPVMCMSLLGAAIYINLERGITETDIWWHLRDAHALLAHHIFLRSDRYSFTAAGSPWINFEWLAEIPYYLGFKAAGLQGLMMVYFIILVLIFIGVYYRSCRAGADCKDAAITTLAAICLGGVSMAPRMLLFGWLCLTGLLLVLEHFKRTGRGLWLLPALFLLWINFHGSWVFGFVVLGATILSGLVEGEWGLVVARRWSPQQLKKLLIATMASFAALFINPFGYRLVWYPFDLLFRQQNVMRYIDEWQPVDFGDINGKLAMVLIFAVFAAVLFCRRRWALDDAMLTAFALWVGLSHARFMFFAGLIIAPILAPDLKLFPPYDPEVDKPWLNAIVIAGVISAMVFSFPTEAKLQQKIDAAFPKAALDFMQHQHINGRLFNQYGWGGYIEWNAPELKPGIDGRADIFVYNGGFTDFLDAMALKRSFETLDKYRIEYVLIQPKEPMAYLLERSPAWRQIYSDNVAVLFQRFSLLATATQVQ
jgi:hypothetical protein